MLPLHVAEKQINTVDERGKERRGRREGKRERKARDRERGAHM